MTARIWLAIAGIGAACAATGASAATIIQFDSEQGANKGFTGFDTALGTLDKVTLDISLAKSRVWQVSVASNTATSVNLGYTVNGNWQLTSGTPTSVGTLVSLTGTATQTVALNNVSNGRAFGFFEVAAAGSRSLDLDPTQFLNRQRTFNGFDLGYNPGSGDTSFTGVPLGGALVQLGGACFVSGGQPVASPEDFCGAANYKLTYSYTPKGAVPEPATWAMMLAGFATTGVALRRRRRATVAA